MKALAPIILAVCALDLRPLDLGAMTLERARILDGKPVTAKPTTTVPKAANPALCLIPHGVDATGRARCVQ
ncbi:MAG: hypothetical protein K8U57_31300 [Planctomycetes bacterium]|nr:hypothetical protein [Planctomycetota bacterium]